MPLNEANVSIYTPSSGQLLSAAPSGEGIAPVHATQKMVFSIPMTRVGSDVYTRDSRTCDRIKAVLLHSEDWSTPMIAQALRLHETTIVRHLMTTLKKKN